MSRVIREIYEDCDLHKALMNTGYTMYRKNYYGACEANGFKAGMDTGKVVDYYVPAIDYTSQRYESQSVTRWRLRELDRRLGTDFSGDYERDNRGFAMGL